MAAGYVYILLNPAMPDYLKIGRTNRSSEDRAAELSATTGIPTRFHVAYDVLVSDCEAVEKIIHQRFSTRRASVDREFFCVSLKEAISTLTEVALGFPVASGQVDTRPTVDSRSASTPTPGPWRTVRDDDLWLVERQVDQSSDNIRYSVRLYPPGRSKLFPHYEYKHFVTKWVPSTVLCDEALSGSLAWSDKSKGSQVHVDYVGGGSDTYYEFNDGSTYNVKSEANCLIRKWLSLTDSTQVCNWAAALEVANTIIAEHPESSLGYHYKSRALYSLNRTSEAATMLRSVIGRFQDDNELVLDFVCYEWVIGNQEGARSILKRHARRLMPKHVIRSRLSDRNEKDFFSGQLEGLIKYVNRWLWI